MKHAANTFIDEEKPVEVHGLRPRMDYVFRLQLLNAKGNLKIGNPGHDVKATTLSIQEDSFSISEAGVDIDGKV